MQALLKRLLSELDAIFRIQIITKNSTGGFSLPLTGFSRGCVKGPWQ